MVVQAAGRVPAVAALVITECGGDRLGDDLTSLVEKAGYLCDRATAAQVDTAEGRPPVWVVDADAAGHLAKRLAGRPPAMLVYVEHQAHGALNTEIRRYAHDLGADLVLLPAGRDRITEVIRHHAELVG